MELNFSKKTRKIVASLLAVAILLGVLPVSGLTGNSSGAEGNNSSANTIFVKSGYQPVLFDSNGKVKSVLTKKDGTENVYTATPENGDKIGVFKDKDFGTGKSIVFFKSNEWNAPCVYLWQGEVNNGGFTDTKMTKLSDGIYYSVYQSNTYKQAVFNNGNKNEKTGDLTLIDFGVYVHNSDGSISNESSAEYFNCVDYKESNNIYEFTADSNTWKEANVNKPAPNVTISGNGKDEVKVIEKGAGKDVSYTYYSNQKVVANASNVTGFTASEVEYSNNVYSVTYTSNEYNFISYEFTSGTVSFEELDALTVTGEWKVYDGDKEISDDTVVKVTGDEKITAKYELTSAEYQGIKVSEDDLKITLQLNDKDYSNGSEIMSADLNPKNKLSGKAEYNGQTANIETYTFNCDKAKKVSVDKNDATDGNLYITGTRIYSSEASAEVKIGYVEDAKDYSIKVKSGDSDKNIPSITKTGTKSFSIGNIDKIGDSTVTLTASYTLHNKEISKDFSLHFRDKKYLEDKVKTVNITYSNTKKDTTGKDIRTWVSAEEAKNNPIKVYFYFGSENENKLIKSINYSDDLKAKYDENIGKWYVEIKEAKTYDFKVTDQVSNTSNITINEADLYIDKTAPKITSFKFESVSSEKDKLFSFLTFGIYHNDDIKVTVSAVDNGYSSVLKDITLSEKSGDKSSVIEADPTGKLKYDEDNKIYTKSFILSSVEGAETAKFKLSATATDNVGNEGYESITSDKVKIIKDGIELVITDKGNFEVVVSKEKPKIAINDEDITPLEKTSKYTDKGNMYFSSGANIKFTVEDKISGIKNVEVYLDGNGEDKSGTPLDVTSKSEGGPASYDQLEDKTESDTFSCSTGDLAEGEHTIYIYAQNNSGNNLNGGCVSKTFYVDKTPSKITWFTFTDNKGATDKLLSFLTFGIYHNDSINVKVTASDNASGVGSITLYGAGKPQTKELNGNNSAEFTFTLNRSNDAYKIYASTDDNVKNTKGFYTINISELNNLSKYRKKYVSMTDEYLYATDDDSNDFSKGNYLIYRENEDDILAMTKEIVSSNQKPEIQDFNLSATNGLDAVNLNGKNWYSSDVKTNFTVDGGLSGINSVKLFVDTYEENEKITEFPQDNNNAAGKEISMVTSNGSDSNNSTGSSSAVFGHLNDSYFTAQEGKITEAEFIYLTNQKGELSEGKHTITIFVRSNNYEFSYAQKTFYIDRSTPKVTEFKFSPTVTNNSNNEPVENKNAYGYYVNQKTRVTVTATDTEDDTKTDVKPVSGVKEIFYKAVDFKGKTILNESKSVNSNNSVSFDVEPNFKGYIYAYAVDNVYNGSEDANYKDKVADKHEFHPDGLVVENGEMHAKSSGITATLPKSSYSANGNPLYSGDITIPVTVTDSYSGIKQIEYSVKSNYDTQNNQSQTVDIANSVSGSSVGGWSFDEKDNNLVTQMSRNITVKNNSNDIVLTVKLTDRAGNKTEIEKKFSIDKTKPVIDVKYDNNEHTTYGGNDYYKADRTATVTVTERNFDESLVEAAIMRNGGRYTTIGGWTHNNNTADPDKSTHVAKIVYNTDGDFTFDIAVKDKAMNSADKFTQQKFTVDKTAPVIDVSFDNNSAKNGNYYKADRTATIKITEHNFNSGSQYVNIPVTAEGTTAPSVVGWSGSGDDHNATVSFNKDGKYSFTVDYTDLAGNKAVQKKVDSFYIDKTAPEVEITGVADHQAYNGTVAPVVTYRDDNFTDDHDFRFTKIDINGKSDDTSKFDYDTGGNGVTEFIYKYRDFAEVLENDGIYNFTVELSDKAGNSTSKSVTFSVNRFGSTFKASDESKKLINNGYTNAEQDIVIEEINVTPLTKHSVTLAKSGGNSTELVENTDYTFTSSNNGNEWCKSVYTVNKKNFSDEAAYTVTIMSVDKAKNTNNNRMADSSLSTEQKNKRECAISFVVDKTSPLVSITGIKDNELYKEASKKVKIVCEDDNLDKSKLVVTLDNKKLAEGEDYTIVDDKDGSIAGMLTAEIVLKAETGGIKENLKVTIGDLAGNTGEKSVDNFILSANIFQRFFANPVLVICTFAGLALVIAAVIFFVAKKRKKAE